MSNNFYGAIVLTGGGSGALDAIDGANLADLDGAVVITATSQYLYTLDADSGLAESSPNIIAPNNNPGNKRWILIGMVKGLDSNKSVVFQNYRSTPIKFITQGVERLIIDAIDSYTKLLLHMDGINSSTVFIDSETIPKEITANGNAQIDTARSKFGGASGLFDGDGDYLSIPASSDFDVGSGDFTIDFWFYTATTDRQFFWAANTDYHYGIDYSSIASSGTVGIWASSTGASWNLINADPGGNGIGSIVLSLNAWHHIVMVRNGNNWMTFIDGVKDIDITVSGTVVDTSTNEIRIGKHPTVVEPNLIGYLDEFRFSKGIARWTVNFTLPQVSYGSLKLSSDLLMTVIKSGATQAAAGAAANELWKTASHATLPDNVVMIGV